MPQQPQSGLSLSRQAHATWPIPLASQPKTTTNNWLKNIFPFHGSCMFVCQVEQQQRREREKSVALDDFGREIYMARFIISFQIRSLRNEWYSSSHKTHRQENSRLEVWFGEDEPTTTTTTPEAGPICQTTTSFGFELGATENDQSVFILKLPPKTILTFVFKKASGFFFIFSSAVTYFFPPPFLPL